MPRRREQPLCPYCRRSGREGCHIHNPEVVPPPPEQQIEQAPPRTREQPQQYPPQAQQYQYQQQPQQYPLGPNMYPIPQFADPHPPAPQRTIDGIYRRARELSPRSLKERRDYQRQGQRNTRARQGDRRAVNDAEELARYNKDLDYKKTWSKNKRAADKASKQKAPEPRDAEEQWDEEESYEFLDEYIGYRPPTPDDWDERFRPARRDYDDDDYNGGSGGVTY